MDDLKRPRATRAPRQGKAEPDSLPAFCGKGAPQLPASAMRDEPLHRVFKEVGQTFQQQMLQQMRAEGITDIFPGVTSLILHLGDEDGLTLSELGKRCHLENSTMTPLVDELEQRHLVLRARDPQDRRLVRLYLTERGRTLEPRLRTIIWRLQEIAVDGISDDALTTTRQTLERIVHNLTSLSLPDTS